MLIRGKRYPVVDLYIRSHPLVASLERLGMGAKSLDRIALPEFVDSRDFWRGAVDGDGTAGDSTLLLCGGKDLVAQFASYLQRHGVSPVREYRHQTARCWYARVVGGKQTRDGISLLYSDCALALDRKLAAVHRIRTTGKV